MRRIWASLMVALFSFMLISPVVLSAPDDLKLPACCRKGGKHHCAMDRIPASSAPALQASPCPLFNTIESFPLLWNAAGLVKVSQAIFAAVVSHPANRPQTEALARISFDRSCQKRGPPSLS